MRIWFSKYESAGNDFMILDMRIAQTWNGFSLPEFARRYCSRRYGVGADGILVLLPPSSPEFDYRMRVFNADGSEAEMSGNGISCLGRYVFDMRLKESDTLVMETLAGRRYVYRTADGIKVDMGVPRIVSEVIHKGLRGTMVDVGNPHIVFFGEFSSRDLSEIASFVSKERNANVELVTLRTSDEADVLVWERGAGETLACGTGAAAVAEVGLKTGLFSSKGRIRLKFPGGEIWVTREGYNIFIETRPNFVFSGYVEIKP